MREGLLSTFYDVALSLNQNLNVVPLLYGSLGLEIITQIDFAPQDIDVLVPVEFVSNKWADLETLIVSKGFHLTDIHEHEFTRGNIKIVFASIENLEDFAGIDYRQLEVKEVHEATHLILSLNDYLKVYKQSVQDGYRKTKKNKKDAEKIEIISKLINKESI
jgi:hypothetical protein